MTDDLPNKKAIGSELMQGTRSARRGDQFSRFCGGCFALLLPGVVGVPGPVTCDAADYRGCSLVSY